MPQPLTTLASQVAGLLRHTNTRVVFAESCTGGLVSAVLARVPGISDFHCGSAVVYRLDTKTKWLGVPETMLCEFGAVSDPVARSMALGVLQKTPEAVMSAAITGHLGPNAPEVQDGLVFVAVARRESSLGEVGQQAPQTSVAVFERRIPTEMSEPIADGVESLREWRQWKATELVLTLVRDELLQHKPS